MSTILTKRQLSVLEALANPFKIIRRRAFFTNRTSRGYITVDLMRVNLHMVSDLENMGLVVESEGDFIVTEKGLESIKTGRVELHRPGQRPFHHNKQKERLY